MMHKLVWAFVAVLGMAAPAVAQEEDLLVALQDYVDFATYEQGIILPAQIDQSVFEAATFVDTRDAEQFEAGHIPGALNIEWRELPYRMDEVPGDGLVIFYCNTGTISAQAMLMARLAGRENVVVLQTGRNGWLETGAYHP